MKPEPTFDREEFFQNFIKNAQSYDDLVSKISEAREFLVYGLIVDIISLRNSSLTAGLSSLLTSPYGFDYSSIYLVLKKSFDVFHVVRNGGAEMGINFNL